MYLFATYDFYELAYPKQLHHNDVTLSNDLPIPRGLRSIVPYPPRM